MPRAARLLFGAIALSAVLAAGDAHAAKPGLDAVPVAVLAVKSDDALDQAEALTAALRSAVLQSQGWSLGEANQSLEFLALKMKCGDPIDAACETRIADVIKADRFLWSEVKLGEGGKVVVGTLHFFVRGKGTSTADVRFPASASEARQVEAEASALFAKVTGGAPNGGVKIATGGVEAQLYVDGKPIGAVPAAGGTYQLAVGAHDVTVKAQGFQDTSLRVQIQPLGTVDATFELLPVEKPSSVDGRMIAGFATLGAGLALGAVGVWAAIDVNSLNQRQDYRAYRDQFTQGDDACDAAKNGFSPAGANVKPGAADAATVTSLCGQARRDEVIQAIAFPVGAVAAGISGYLLATSSLGKSSDEAPKPSAWTVIPELGPQRQTLTVRYSF